MRCEKVLCSKGFAHGFSVLLEIAVFQYKCDEFYHPEADGGISILDDSLGVDWRIKGKTILSEKDTKHPLLIDFDSPFVYKENNSLQIGPLQTIF